MVDSFGRFDSFLVCTKQKAEMMRRADVQDLLDRQSVLVDTIEAGVSERDRHHLEEELREVRAALAIIRPAKSRGSSASV